MTTLSITNQATAYSQSPLDRSCRYVLCWRQKQLLVKSTAQPIQPYLPPLGNLEVLMACLQRSPIQLVRIAPELGESEIEFWADACAGSGKNIFLTIPSPNLLLKQQKLKPQWLKWGLKRMMDWIAALSLLLLLAPLLLIITILLWLESPGPVLSVQWRVGQRGRLFRMLKFRRIALDVKPVSREHSPPTLRQGIQTLFLPIEKWLLQSGLSELPQLINVLRGEMSLVGPRPWQLADALQLDPTARQQLNGLPGMTGIWTATIRSPLPDLDSMSSRVLNYLSNWSIQQDFKILVMTIPRVFSGFGPY